MLPKKFISVMIALSMIVCFLGLAWMFIQTPGEFKKGIYPVITETYTHMHKEFDDRISAQEKALKEHIELTRTMLNQNPKWKGTRNGN